APPTRRFGPRHRPLPAARPASPAAGPGQVGCQTATSWPGGRRPASRPMPSQSAPSPADALAKIGDLAASADLRRIHVLAWRDLDDVEAGGSEVHASEVARLWAEAGIEVT